MERYEVLDCFYTSPENGVMLYHAIDKAANAQVILKYIKVPGGQEEFDILRKEGDNQIRLNDHPYICKVYDFTSVTDYTTTPPAIYMVLSLEQCTIDLDKLWSSRTANMQYFDENYLWTLLYECVEALAFAQDFDICHRDIKPPNILLGTDGHVRICDFGSSKYIQKAQEMASSTLQGTPQFLSPKQRQHLVTFLLSGQLSKVMHDPYKSDVFSLGYTFLIVSLLRNSNCGQNLQGIEGAVYAEVQNLCYTDNYKQLIFWMMTVNEDDRPDFQQLRSCLRPYFLPSIAVPEACPSSCVIYNWHSVSTDPRDPPVTLLCNPQHVICSSHCFRDFVFTSTQQYALELDAVCCPRCQAPISPDLVYRAYGGERLFAREREKLIGLCTCGSDQNVRKMFKCSHRLCNTCWTNKHQPQHCPVKECGAALIQKKKPKSCEVF